MKNNLYILIRTTYCKYCVRANVFVLMVEKYSLIIHSDLIVEVPFRSSIRLSLCNLRRYNASIFLRLILFSMISLNVVSNSLDIFLNLAFVPLRWRKLSSFFARLFLAES